MDRLQNIKDKIEREQMERILRKHFEEAIYRAMNEWAEIKNRKE